VPGVEDLAVGCREKIQVYLRPAIREQTGPPVLDDQGATPSSDTVHWPGRSTERSRNDSPKPAVWHRTADQILGGRKKYLTNL